MDAIRQLLAPDIVNYDSDSDESVEDTSAATTQLAPRQFIHVIVSVMESHEVLFAQPVLYKKCLTSQVLLMNLFYSSDFKKIKRLPRMPCSPPKALSWNKISMGTTKFSGELGNPRIFCAAPATDGYFYRAELMERTSPSTVRVSFVDFGGTEIVECSQLMELPKRFRKLRPGCFKCRLGKNFPQEIDLTKIRDAIEGNQLVLRIDSLDPDNGCPVVTPFLVKGSEEWKFRDKFVEEWEKTDTWEQVPPCLIAEDVTEKVL